MIIASLNITVARTGQLSGMCAVFSTSEKHMADSAVEINNGNNNNIDLATCI